MLLVQRKLKMPGIGKFHDGLQMKEFKLEIAGQLSL